VHHGLRKKNKSALAIAIDFRLLEMHVMVSMCALFIYNQAALPLA